VIDPADTRKHVARALEYVESIGIRDIIEYEERLLRYATERLKELDSLKIYGNAEKKISVISFLMGDIHPYDTGMVLDKMGIAVRTGTHCTQPVMERFGISGTIRASMVFYNTTAEIDMLVSGLQRVQKMFG